VFRRLRTKANSIASVERHVAPRWVLLVLLTVLGCAPPTRYRYVAGTTHVVRSVERHRDPRVPDAVILLGPELSACVAVDDTCDSPAACAPSCRWIDGPARLSLVAGRRALRLRSAGADEEREWSAEWNVEHDFRPATVYEIFAKEAENTVSWELVEIQPGRYAQLHAKAPPELRAPPKLPPRQRPSVLTSGLQPDGSIVLAGDSFVGPMHVSAALLPCEVGSLGELDRSATLTYASLLQSCKAQYSMLERPRTAQNWRDNLASAARCAYERHGSKGRFDPAALLAGDLCRETLGEDWHLPTAAELTNLTSDQLRQLARPLPGDRQTELITARFLFARDTSGDIVTVDVYARSTTLDADAEQQARLRCVRVPVTATPKPPALRACRP
jgi:hypothetical protein